MDWSMIGALGEIAGAAAVVASLIYVASQIRQTRALARAEAFRAYQTELAHVRLAMAADVPTVMALRQVFFEGAGRADLADADATRFGVMCLALLSTHEAAYRSALEGVLDLRDVRQMVSSTQLFHRQYVIDSWPIWRQEITPAFARWFEDLFPHLAEIAEAQDTQTSLPAAP